VKRVLKEALGRRGADLKLKPEGLQSDHYLRNHPPSSLSGQADALAFELLTRLGVTFA
jgi:hypothetical protein